MMTDIGNFVVLTLRMEVSKNGGTPIAGCFFWWNSLPPKKKNMDDMDDAWGYPQ